MRPPSDMPSRPSRRRRRRPPREGRGRTVVIVAVVLLFVLVTSLRGIASFYTDYLWFQSLRLTSVWRGILGAKSALTIIFTVVFFAMAWISLMVADRLAPPFRVGEGTGEDLVERYHELVGPRAGMVRIGVAAILALIEGTSVSGEWRDWILFTHRVNFGTHDATFHTDIGFYVFQLPFLRFLVGWIFGALVLVLLATLLAHYLNGGIRMQVPGDRVSPQVKAHVSVLLGLLLLVKAGGYWLQRYELVFSTRGTVDGATYTDVNVQLKAIYLLIIICVTSFVLFLVNIRRRGWVLPIIAVGLWAFVAILAGQAVPGLVQRFRVQPDEPSKESPYIVHNIAATRQALGLATVATKKFAANDSLDGTVLAQNADVVRNIRLWDPSVVVKSLQISQGSGLRGFYAIDKVDVDRYTINGQVTEVNVAARELNAGGIPQSSWVAQHLTYTHGYGTVLSPSNATTSGGQPLLDVKDIPQVSTKGNPAPSQPRIYIGEQQGGYAIVKTKANEFDYEDDAGNAKDTSYTGKDGIALNSFTRRFAFALRFGQIDPLISSQVTSKSKILLQRDVAGRLDAVAPFLQWDSDPYPVYTRTSMVWVVDGYTTTSRYPNAQRADVGDLPGGAQLKTSFNYVRNSVKATVDAYDGTIRLYVVDPTDPLIRSYRKAFPKLFTDGTKVPTDIRAHFRYPQDLFRVQTTMWGRYHLNDPGSFYSRSDEWNVAPDPALSLNTADGATTDIPVTTTISSSNNVSNQPGGDRVDPYYLELRLPGSTKAQFTLLRPFVATSKNNATRAVTAFMAVSSDPGSYGKLESYVMPPSQLPPGPQDIVQAMNGNAAVSQKITFLCQQQASCTTTNLLVIPIGQSLLYMRPLYVESEAGNQNSPPQLQYVIVAYVSKGSIEVTLQTTLAGALKKFFGSSPATLEHPKGGTTTTTTPTTKPPTGTGGSKLTAAELKLIDEVSAAFDSANAALKKGDLATYATDINKAQALFAQLQTAETAPVATPTTTTTIPGIASPTTTTTTPSGSGTTTTLPGTTTVPRSGGTTTTTKPSA